MGVLPLQFKTGENTASLDLTGKELFSIEGLSGALTPQGEVDVRAVHPAGHVCAFKAVVRLNSPIEVEYYRNGGILHTVLRELLK